ncbi:hypothetical protein DFH07DRAFT_821558 [Mycena maculata]|uniref:Uncharacterized protein n=1 Tax=Mycena maculata TaxID=230809 RepID=A0AAD7ND62_9AGAR|nr:hypothetical protein DFH07DRAFT_821558 [Mycena maculata]
MSYSYYQQNAPGWGTNQFQFPPPPSFQAQPQPNWGGRDFYNAHAVNPDSSLYDHAWEGVRQYSGSTLEQGVGVGMHEAKHWHRRAYGGLGELNQMLPSEIGHAAAYEAYRTWIHNSSMSEPLSGDVERQREGLAGLAVAEASRLLQFSNRSMDSYARVEASEAAAATASIIFYHSRARDDGEYGRSRSRSRARRRSFSNSYDEPYALDAHAGSSSYPRHRSSSRHRSHSTASRHSPMMPFQGSQMAGSMAGSNVAPVPIPSGAPSGYGAPSPYGSYGGPGSAAGSYGAGMPMGGGVPMQIHGQGSPYGTTAGMMPVSQSYSAIPMVGPMGSRPRSNSTSMYPAQYPQVQYAQPGQYMVPRTMVAQPQAIILGSGHRKHRKKSKRSRSTDYPRYSSSSRY